MHSLITNPALIALAIVAVVVAALFFLRRNPTPVETALGKLEAKRRFTKRTGQIPSQLDVYDAMCSNESKQWSVRELSAYLRLNGFGQSDPAFRPLNRLVKRHLRRLESRRLVNRTPQGSNARRHGQQFAFRLAA